MRPVVVYTNNCSAANSRELQITKKMNPDVETSDTFTFNINWEPANRSFRIIPEIII